MAFAFVAGVNKAVLALVVELHQHTHGAPLGSPERAELQVLVSGQSEKGIAAVHEVTGHQWVRVSDGGQGVGRGAGNEADYKENLQIDKKMLFSIKICIKVDIFAGASLSTSLCFSMVA